MLVRSGMVLARASSVFPPGIRHLTTLESLDHLVCRDRRRRARGAAKAAASLKEQTKPTMLEPHHRKRNPQTDVKL